MIRPAYGDEEVPRRLWETWKKCRNRIFHFFPKFKQVISLEEAEERLRQIFETMEFVGKKVVQVEKVGKVGKEEIR